MDSLADGATAPPRDTAIARAGSAVFWTALVALSVATAGAVDPAAAAALAGSFLVAALVRRDVGPIAAPTARAPLWSFVRASPARVAVAAALVACAVQLLPLPEAVRAVLAPGPASARADLRALGLAGSWAPITVDVGATANELILWAGAAAAIVVLTRPTGVPFGARLAVALLVALHGLAWIDWLVGTHLLPLTYIEDPWGVGQATLRDVAYVSGWLVNKTHWAALGAILWPLAVAWGWRDRSAARRVAGSLAGALVLVSTVASRSRAGTAVVALQVAVLLAVLAWRAPRRVRLAVLLAVVAAAFVGRGAIEAFVARVRGEDVIGRGELYRATARMVPDSPVVGWGMGSFEAAFPAYQPEFALYKYSHAHCDPLEWIAGAGVFGLVLVGGLLLEIVRGARDGRASPLARSLWTASVLGGAGVACFEFPLQVAAVRLIWLGVLVAGPPRTGG